MENQENNNLSELDQLKAQYETLKQQFDQQEIVNDRLMKSSIKHSTDFYQWYRRTQTILYPLVAIIGFLCIKRYLGGGLSLMLFWGSFCAVCLAVELWMTLKLRTKTMENNDLLTLSQHARSFKKLYFLYIALSSVPSVIVVVGFLISKYGINTHLSNLSAFLIMLCFILLFLVGYGFFVIRFATRPCDAIIQQIETAETTVNKEIGSDKKQRWFRTAMFVAFIGLAVWACAIVMSRLKLPPMWHSVEYVRPVDDLSTEGRLAIWDVEADTLAFSSTTMGGQPMIAKVSATYPRRFTNTESEPMMVYLTPEASQLWYQFTTDITGHRAALVMDGVVIQDWKVMCGLDNGSFFIMKEWGSKEELETFCEKLIKQ